jgi:transposase-like protein
VSKNPLPTTLIEAVRYFADPEVCVQFVASLRWENGPVCPKCGGTEHYYLATRRVWKCKNRECRKQFSVKVGTIFEDSAIPLDKWLCSIWLIANSKNGISSHELGRLIGLTQKSAWFVLHRIRLAMRTGTFARFDGEVETDESYFGGVAKNRHDSDTRSRKPGGSDKAMVVGSLQRGRDGGMSRVFAEVLPEGSSPRSHVYGAVSQDATLYTDSARFYMKLRDEYKHEVVDHSRGEYVRGRVSTNSIENFWTLLKRGIFGTYVQVDPEHLHRYVDERAFTFNLRDLTDLERFREVLSRIAGRRLTWAQLTA